jgi:hypothetical protein
MLRLCRELCWVELYLLMFSISIEERTFILTTFVRRNRTAILTCKFNLSNTCKLPGIVKDKCFPAPSSRSRVIGRKDRSPNELFSQQLWVACRMKEVRKKKWLDLQLPWQILDNAWREDPRSRHVCVRFLHITLVAIVLLLPANIHINEGFIWHALR